MSFAIPINVALKVKDQILATGRASHAQLGVTIQDLNQTLANAFGLSRPDGALVANVAPNGAAAGAGLLPGDVITEINGELITRSGDLSGRVGMAAPGETVRLKVWRDRAAREIVVKLGRADDGASAQAERGAETQPGQLGLTMRPLTRDERENAQLQAGLVIERVAGPAVSAGLRPGDVLLAINGVPVKSNDQVSRLLAKKPKSVALLIQRDGQRVFVPVELG
jgi:serine protease Do